MLISSINQGIQQLNGNIKVQKNIVPKYNTTNPMANDTYICSVTFKASIHEYAKNGELDKLKDELNDGVDVNVKDITNNTPLHHAAYYNRSNVVKYLLSRDDIDVNAQGRNGNTPLMKALDDGDSDVVALFLEREDLDLTIENQHGDKAIDLAEKYARRSWYTKLKEMTEYQIQNAGSISKRITINNTEVDIQKLSPEENIWTGEQISKKFLSLVKKGRYDEAETMLQRTPLIDLEGNGREILNQICKTGNSDLAEKVFDYKFHKQEQMLEEYNKKRQEFLDNKIKQMTYAELKANQIALYTVGGFKILMEKEEFNPNDIIAEGSLFDIACNIDKEGNLVKEILSKYEDVDVSKWRTIRNEQIKNAVNEYESKGKYQLRMDNIKRKLISTATRNEGISQLKDFINSEEFKPEMTDTMGNSALHIVSTIADDSSRGLIEKLIRKGVDINVKNVTNQNPIMSAIRALMGVSDEEEKTGLLSNIKFLMDKGSDIENQDKNGQTVFHYVCATTSAALLTMILAKEPNVLVRDLRGNRGNVYLKNEKMKEIYEKYING